jgi:hypothetical protein
MLSFSIVILILLIIGIFSIIELNIIEKEIYAEDEVFELRSHLSEHLEKHLIDKNLEDLNIPLDHQKSDLGVWLHSEDRFKDEKLVPETAPFFLRLEKENKELHETIKVIFDLYATGDTLKAVNYFSKHVEPHIEEIEKIFTGLEVLLCMAV